MGEVTSRDGTSIAYEVAGAGPTVILVGGGVDDGSENAPLVPELSENFTVINYARRGRGGSGDTLPYAVEREFEDVAALIIEAGGSAHLYGVSSGGALALGAAAAGLPIDKVAVYEVPYDLADDWPHRWQAYVERLDVLLAQGRRGDAFELFMRLAGSDDAEIAAAGVPRRGPGWRPSPTRSPTTPPASARATHPQTGSLRSPSPPSSSPAADRPAGAPDWVLALDPAADAIAARIPHAQRLTLPGQSHTPDPAVVAPALTRFLTGTPTNPG